MPSYLIHLQPHGATLIRDVFFVFVFDQTTLEKLSFKEKFWEILWNTRIKFVRRKSHFSDENHIQEKTLKI